MRARFAHPRAHEAGILVMGHFDGFTSDEEVGSPSTRDLIEAEAARSKHILVPEPGRPVEASSPAGMRLRASTLKRLVRPSHAGARLKEGRSAIREMARQIIAIDDMTTDDCTFSVGVVHGGHGSTVYHEMQGRGA